MWFCQSFTITNPPIHWHNPIKCVLKQSFTEVDFLIIVPKANLDIVLYWGKCFLCFFCLSPLWSKKAARSGSKQHTGVHGGCLQARALTHSWGNVLTAFTSERIEWGSYSVSLMTEPHYPSNGLTLTTTDISLVYYKSWCLEKTELDGWLCGYVRCMWVPRPTDRKTDEWTDQKHSERAEGIMRVQDISGGCGWGVERSFSNLKVGSSIPSLPHLHAEGPWARCWTMSCPS